MQTIKLVDGGVVYQRPSRPRRPGFARWLVLTLCTAALLGTGAWRLAEQQQAAEALAYYPQ
ncbi:MAG: hypothetical protein IT546_02140 [Caulobacteraceae bacterium]|nr:hypothetical protein [Caulobacteraceae bacterium]